MRKESLALFILVGIESVQSLSELAQQEAERRKSLEQVEGRVIEAKNATKSGAPSRQTKPKSSDAAVKTPSSNRYRAAIQKLDLTISRTRQELKKAQDELASERWAIPKAGRVSSASNQSTIERLKKKIEQLQTKLKDAEQERLTLYESGRKEGLLPGDLDGHGIVP